MSKVNKIKWLERKYSELQDNMQDAVNYLFFAAMEYIIEVSTPLRLTISFVVLVACVMVSTVHLPRVLWTCLMKDFIILMSPALILASCSGMIAKFDEFSTYENRKVKFDIQNLSQDVPLCIWEGENYYSYVSKKNPKYVCIGYSVNYPGDETSRSED